MPRIRPASARFQAKVQIASDGCWIWTGYVNGFGYGSFRYNGANRPAHRFAYEHYIGPIPDGLELDHTCKNRQCVNPAHLEPVTHQENMLRSEVPSCKAARTGKCKHGHELSGNNRMTNGACRTCYNTYMRAYAQRCRAARAA